MGETILLSCSGCSDRNYSTIKNKKTTKEKLELKKFCPRCGKHTLHKEIK
ncbi:MAG: 50S ribosomal protein L33 [Candidatus Omnitrophica bacterium]|nr:50S ribosomal protein L33 [Candidatus Omnitrophota bacterium]